MGLDGVEIVMAMEDEFKIAISEVRDIAVEMLGVKPEQVRLESHWVNDL